MFISISILILILILMMILLILVTHLHYFILFFLFVMDNIVHGNFPFLLFFGSWGRGLGLFFYFDYYICGGYLEEYNLWGSGWWKR